MTKKTGMSAKDRRALILGLVVLLPSLFYVFGVRRYMAAVKDTHQLVTDERKRLSQELAAIAAAKEQPQLQHIADSSWKAMSPRIFSGRDNVAAGTDLMTLVGEVALQQNVNVRTAILQSTTVDVNGVRTLAVEIQGETDLQGLLGFLEAIERSDKLMRVDRLRVTRPIAKPDADGVQAIQIAASIAGFAIQEGPVVPDKALRSPAPPTGRGGR
jgi:hypothetical protein